MSLNLSSDARVASSVKGEQLPEISFARPFQDQ
jgi:hypothetical protein